MNNSIVKKAEEFATKAHTGQAEKNQEQMPYIYHVKRVAELVTLSGGTDSEIAAAWLHDVVEDTSITLLDIEKEFGNEIAHIVEGLTDLPGFTNLSNQERKQRQADRVRNENNSVKRVKLADQISAIAIDSVNELQSISERIIYVEGARKIALECRNISTFLDDLFEKTYLEAITFLKK